MRILFVFVVWVFFFFKQKTAYEMRISDWSSDVCSSDLLAAGATDAGATMVQALWARAVADLNRGEGQMAPGEVAMPLRTQFSAPGRKERAGLGVCRRAFSIAAHCGSGRSRSEEHTSELQSIMPTSYAVFCLKQ